LPPDAAPEAVEGRDHFASPPEAGLHPPVEDHQGCPWNCPVCDPTVPRICPPCPRLSNALLPPLPATISDPPGSFLTVVTEGTGTGGNGYVPYRDDPHPQQEVQEWASTIVDVIRRHPRMFHLVVKVKRKRSDSEDDGVDLEPGRRVRSRAPSPPRPRP
jgi:hypothetical protein